MRRIGLMLPTGGYRGPDFVEAADELGVELVVVTDGSLGFTSGRIVKVVEAECDQPELAAAALVTAAAELPIDAVVGVDDQGVMAASLAAMELGLIHNQPDAVAATRDKAVMRALFEKCGVAQPRFLVAEAADEIGAVAEQVGFPVVLKPLALSASRGVIRADDPDAARQAAERIRSLDGASQSVLIEEFMPGPEVAVEALAGADGLEILAVFDKPDPLDGPFFEETLYVTPSSHDPVVLAAVGDLVATAASALGIEWGPVHAEVRLTPEGPRMVELAARSIGGLCGRSLRFGMLSQSLELLLLRSALGLGTRGMRREDRASGVMMLPIPTEGTLVAVRGREAVFEVEGIVDLQITVPMGRHILPLPEGDRYLGFLFAEGETPADVEAALREGHGLLEVVIAPAP